MDKLDDEAEAFFRIGDEGTYDGGPATFAPIALFEEPPDASDYGAVDAWLERRRRSVRFIVPVIGGLGTGLLVLALCVLVARSRGAEGASSQPERQAVPRVDQPPVVSAAAVAAAPEPRERSEPVVIEEAVRPAPLASQLAMPHPIDPSASHRQTSFEHTRRRSPLPLQQDRADPRPLPQGRADLPPTSATAIRRREPPTAFFAN